MTRMAARAMILPILASGLLGSGCGPSRPRRVPAPPVDPAAITNAVMQLADGDADGLLTAAELVRAPGLAADRPALDTDGDKRISAAELTAWLTAIRDSRVAITPMAVRVTRKGKPLSTVTVKLMPEPFMGPQMNTAEATTDEGGIAMPSIPGSAYLGVNCGLYRVEITGSLPDGTPIPAKYNSSTSLGLAVGNGLPATSPVEFRVD